MFQLIVTPQGNEKVTIQLIDTPTKVYVIGATNVQKLDVPGPDEKICLCWLCAFTKFSSGGAIFTVHLIFEHL